MSNRPNGCGPKGILGKLIPDNLFGLSVNDACNNHDKLYSVGGNSDKRKVADQVFLFQMLRKINAADDGKWLSFLRKIKAYTYYFSVRLWGKFFYQSY